MADKFWRFPIDGGDQGTWGPFNDAMNNAGAIGQYTSQLINNAGNLQVTRGLIGINDGTNEGVVEVGSVATVDISGVTSGIWAKIEMSVSGTTYTFTATDIAGATAPAALPSGFTDAYDTTKQGFYISSNKRTIGLAWKDSGGTLRGIINTSPFIDGYAGKVFLDTAETKELHYLVKLGVGRKWAIYALGDWDMNTSTNVSITHILGSEWTKARTPSAVILNDALTAYYDINYLNSVGALGGGISVTNTSISVARVTGGFFDVVGFSTTPLNRGYAQLELEL
jgi:hypothetical protein